MGACVSKRNKSEKLSYSQLQKIASTHNMTSSKICGRPSMLNFLRIDGQRTHQSRQNSELKSINKFQNISKASSIVLSTQTVQGEPQQQSFNESIKPLSYINNMIKDPSAPFGIKNLPQAWKNSLSQSNLLSEQLLSDYPETVMEIITTFDSVFHESVIQKKLITASQFQKIIEKVQFLPFNPQRQYKFMNVIGQGSTCKVQKAISKMDNKVYAVRLVRIQQVELIRKIKSQIAVMHICENPYTIQYHFTYHYDNQLFMFTEFMNAGSLTNFIKKFKGKISERLIAYILKQILLGLEAIHSKFQIHRDIKSDNILLNTQGQIKIGDFGAALQLTKQSNNANQPVGTPAWMAPQLIKKQEYNQKVDIWALGIVAIQICRGQPPNFRMSQMKTMYMTLVQPSPTISGYSKNFTHFVDECLKKNPEQRPTSRQLLSHPFLLEIEDSKLQQEELKKLLLTH